MHIHKTYVCIHISMHIYTHIHTVHIHIYVFDLHKFSFAAFQGWGAAGGSPGAGLTIVTPTRVGLTRRTGAELLPWLRSQKV